jgi:alpha,alpha-trehalase
MAELTDTALTASVEVMSTHKTELGPQFTAERLKPALQFIDVYWKRLERFSPHDDGTLVGLPRPYFVPSVGNDTGFQFEEMYYWDTFFIAQGLFGTPREHLARGLAENLIALMNRFQIIPNSGRFYHTGHSHPPFLTTFILQVYHTDRNKRWLEQSMAVAKEEYRTVWMGTAHPNWRQVFHGLSRYYDFNVLSDLAEAESGWDMTTRFMRESLSYLPPDLNALLYKYEIDFEEAAKILGDDEEAREWHKRALSRRAMMQKYLWNEQKGCYFDYNYMTGKFSPVYSMATFFPMWAGMDDAETAAQIMKNLDKFEYEGGLACTAKEPQVSSPLPTQWAYPNGWAPLHWIAVQAMERYGYHVAAERIARKWILANLVQFEAKGEFEEKYNVVDIQAEPTDGVYPSQPGFGWTNAIFINFCQKYLKPEEMPHIESVATMPVLSQLVRNPRQTLKRVGSKFNQIVPKRG